LYVALTRAQEKVIISGGVKLGANQQDPGQLLAGGWLKELAGALGREAVRLPAALDAPQALTLAPAWAGRAAVSIFPPPAEAPAPASRPVRPDQRQLRPGRLVPPYQAGETAGAIRAPDRVWRVITGSRSVPAWVVGKLAHEALRRWRLEAAPAELEAQMRPAALAAGLSEDRAIRQALREARRLVERFRAHPLYAEIDSAAERYHELPYLAAGDVGVIDALYRTPLGWTIVDFKTDELRDDGDLGRVLPRYQGQLRRYVEAVRGQLGLRTDPRAILVFLNLRDAVQVVPLEGMGG
jgi:ATP-dependent exoDNAse (exonuclease V) beta subunit